MSFSPVMTTIGYNQTASYLGGKKYKVGFRRVRRMMHLMGIMPVCHRKHQSKLSNTLYIRLYLLRRLEINHRNQVWCIDITYIPIKKGFMYQTVIINVYSRLIVGWSLHNIGCFALYRSVSAGDYGI